MSAALPVGGVPPLMISTRLPAGAGLAYLLPTDHPVAYAVLLGSAFILYGLMTMTIGEPGWQGAILIAADLLLPAFVAAAATAWLYRRRAGLRHARL